MLQNGKNKVFALPANIHFRLVLNDNGVSLD